MVTTENWTYCGRKLAAAKAQISLGGEPAGETVRNLYLVVAYDKYATLEEACFDNLQEACDYLNGTYQKWEFFDATKTEGCGGCVAH